MVVIDNERMGMANSDVAMNDGAPQGSTLRARLVVVIVDMRVVVREFGVIVEEHLRVFRRP